MKNLEYKGYYGSVEYSEADKCFFGEALELSAGFISYEGSTPEELESDFKDAVDCYLENCERRGLKPGKSLS